MLKSIRYPDLFHGMHRRWNFFEGWYFKIVDAHEKKAYVLISGLNMGNRKQKAHSFIQVYDSCEGAFEYLTYPADAFAVMDDSNDNTFCHKVGDNVFSYHGLTVNLSGNKHKIKGQLQFSRHVRWPDSVFSPGSMGFYNYIPFMECYSQVCAMDMSIAGSLVINDECTDFNGGRGYMEKNWGSAFPLGWIWVQCNHFGNKSVSLSASIGHIPFITGSFRGFLIGFWADGAFHSFTTMNKSTLHIERGTEGVRIATENKTHKLIINVSTDNGQFTTLKGPKNGEMLPYVDETISGVVMVQLSECSTGKIVLSDRGSFAGVEYGGEQMQTIILNNHKKE